MEETKMLKHYCIWQFKKWWPMLLIFSIVLTVIFSYAILSIPLTQRVSQDGPDYSITNLFSQMASYIHAFHYFPALAMTFVMPLFIFHYRTKRQSVDTYYQAAYAPTTIKRARLLIGLGIVVAAFIASALLGTTLFLLRYFGTPAVQVADRYTLYRVAVNWGYYVLAFLIGLLTVVAQYLINCFLVSLGDYVLDQIFLLIFGNAFLFLFITAPMVYLSVLARSNDLFFNIVNNILYYSLGPIAPSALLVSTIPSLAMGNALEGTYWVNQIISTLLYFGFAAACCVFNLLMPDPSGEHADKAGARNKAIALIPHGAGAVIGFLVACLGGLYGVSSALFIIGFLPIFLFIMYGVVYYAILALWRHGFKIGKQDLVCYLSVIGSVLLFISFAMVVAPR